MEPPHAHKPAGKILPPSRVATVRMSDWALFWTIHQLGGLLCGQVSERVESHEIR